MNSGNAFITPSLVAKPTRASRKPSPAMFSAMLFGIILSQRAPTAQAQPRYEDWAMGGWYEGCASEYQLCNGTYVEFEQPIPIDFSGQTCYVNPNDLGKDVPLAVYWMRKSWYQSSSFPPNFSLFNIVLKPNATKELFPNCDSNGVCNCTSVQPFVDEWSDELGHPVHELAADNHTLGKTALFGSCHPKSCDVTRTNLLLRQVDNTVDLDVEPMCSLGVEQSFRYWPPWSYCHFPVKLVQLETTTVPSQSPTTMTPTESPSTGPTTNAPTVTPTTTPTSTPTMTPTLPPTTTLAPTTESSVQPTSKSTLRVTSRQGLPATTSDAPVSAFLGGTTFWFWTRNIVSVLAGVVVGMSAL